MANDLFRQMVSIARDYFHPFFAENLIRKYCENCSTNEDDITTKHLPSIVLAIATDNSLYQKLKFHQYIDMMKRFMAFSTRFERKDPEKLREYVQEFKEHKKNEEIRID